jgi:hypothetical protein
MQPFQCVFALGAMFGTGLRLAAALVDGIATFIAAVSGYTRAALQAGLVSTQRSFGEVVVLREVSYIHVVSVLFLEIEQSIELGV